MYRVNDVLMSELDRELDELLVKSGFVAPQMAEAAAGPPGMPPGMPGMPPGAANSPAGAAPPAPPPPVEAGGQPGMPPGGAPPAPPPGPPPEAAGSNPPPPPSPMDVGVMRQIIREEMQALNGQGNGGAGGSGGQSKGKGKADVAALLESLAREQKIDRQLLLNLHSAGEIPIPPSVLGGDETQAQDTQNAQQATGQSGDIAAAKTAEQVPAPSEVSETTHETLEALELILGGPSYAN